MRPGVADLEGTILLDGLLMAAHGLLTLVRFGRPERPRPGILSRWLEAIAPGFHRFRPVVGELRDRAPGRGLDRRVSRALRGSRAWLREASR